MASDYYKYGTNLSNREFFTSTVDTSYGVKRYFSNIEGEIYFGNKLMEDIYKFDFSVEEKKLPLYGYNCFYATMIVPGQRIVQGSFVLNFTNGNYINSVLSEIEDSVMANNVIECEVYNPSNTERDLPMWSKNFDITIGYGYNSTSGETYNATSQTICCAQIYNVQNVVDVSGEPIMEVYSFIAKDLICSDNSSFNSQNNNNNNNNDDNDDDTNKTKSYLYADKNNSDDFSKKYVKYQKDKDCVNLLHDIKLKVDKNEIVNISVTITDFDNNILNCSDCSILITEQLNYNFTTYKMKKTDKNKFTLSFKTDVNVGNKIYKALKSDKKSKIKCTLKYTVKIDNKKYNIKYDGYVYLDKDKK